MGQSEVPLGWRRWLDLSLRAKCLLLISLLAVAMMLMFGASNISFGLLGGAAMMFLLTRGTTNRVSNQGLITAEEVLRLKGIALEDAPYGIAEVDGSGLYVWLNKRYAELAGCSQSHKPADIAATLQPDDRGKVEEAVAQMRANGRAEITARIGPSVGAGADIGVTFLAAAGDRRSNFYVLLSDIGAVQKGDAALIRAKDAAEASNRAKSEFLAKISHDIRTPLNAILGSVDLLSQTPLSFDQNEYVSMFQRNCRRLVSLINDFLDFSRIEAGAVRMEKAPFRIRDTVDDAVATFLEAAARKGITLGVVVDPAAPQWTLGDPLRIQQVLVNLLSNALKFTVTGCVEVKVKAPGPGVDADALQFEVSDTGPGIRLEDQEKIFARFVQLPNQSNGQRGTGLGLAICRDLVELMGGRIGVLSRESQGSTFYFSLPLPAVEPAAGDPSAADATPAQLSPGEPIRILVAEDTEDNRILLEHYLRDQPVMLRFTVNGQEALDAVQRGEQFDLILMDIDMPVMDGFTAARQIRAWQQSQGPQSRVTPIVALSADAMREAVLASMDAGCVAHVAKPMDRETLLKTIHHFADAESAQSAQPARAIAISDQILALVPQYLASKEKQIEEARAALAARDFGPIRRFGHNLKGTGRGYGFVPIEEMGREIEQAAAQADATRIASQLEALHRFVTESAVEYAKS